MASATFPANPFNWAAIRLIEAYRRRLSPRKGYACPHRLLHHGESCSAAALRLYGTLGPIAATRATLARLWSCRMAAETLARTNDPVPPGLKGDRRRRGQCCIVIPLPTCSRSRTIPR